MVKSKEECSSWLKASQMPKRPSSPTVAYVVPFGFAEIAIGEEACALISASLVRRFEPSSDDISHTWFPSVPITIFLDSACQDSDEMVSLTPSVSFVSIAMMHLIFASYNLTWLAAEMTNLPSRADEIFVTLVVCTFTLSIGTLPAKRTTLPVDVPTRTSFPDHPIQL